tara:strand:- start:2612 stop:3007 length:396 start_codon:yes stop_codon:yes gene_type:complete
MNTKLRKIFAEISAGELVDKITILQIKKEKITNSDKLIDIDKELESLNETFKEYIPVDREINDLSNELKNINFKLWDIEDAKRSLEKKKEFDKEFIELARKVYKFNDERAKLKLQINIRLGSNIKEVKSYK